jgi:23S rRNA pseudouridine955/2504/2580 synthase
MKEIIVNGNEAGQRFDKFLLKYFKEAPASFIYKMLRKKNIVLNGKKSDGKDKLAVGDAIKIFMADETIEKFRGESTLQTVTPIKLSIAYEDENVLIVNKPSGILSQKAEKNDVSINEYIISYLLDSGQINYEQLKTFKPSVCNRLDRNTSGLIVAGKTLKGLQVMSEMFQNRTMDKYYLALVSGVLTEKVKIKGFLAKDTKSNRVFISKEEIPDSRYIETEYEPLQHGKNITLLKVKLITGRAHQIRAHLAATGNAILGDYKYGNKALNDIYKKKYNIQNQMLHSWILRFPVMEGDCSILSQKEIVADIPQDFCQVIKNEIENN